MPQNGIKMSVAVTCHLIACILHNPKLTKLFLELTLVLDHEPSACVGHDAWHSEGLPVPPADVVAKNWGDVLQFLRTPQLAKVKLGTKEFDVGSWEIDAKNCGVSAADCAELAARLKTGEISRVKTLKLVRCV